MELKAATKNLFLRLSRYWSKPNTLGNQTTNEKVNKKKDVQFSKNWEKIQVILSSKIKEFSLDRLTENSSNFQTILAPFLFKFKTFFDFIFIEIWRWGWPGIGCQPFSWSSQSPRFHSGCLNLQKQELSQKTARCQCCCKTCFLCYCDTGRTS